MAPSLPQEVIDQIIDHLDHLQSFCVCSLVCRNWLDASRVHKFWTVILGVTYSRKNLDACPIAAPYIRELVLEGTARFEQHLFGNISGCIQLRRLKIHCITIPSIDEIPSAFPFPMLQELELLQCRTNDFQHLAHLLRNFPHLIDFTSRSCREWDLGAIHELSKSGITSSPPLSGHVYVDETPGYGESNSVYHQGMRTFVHLLPNLPGGVRFQSIKLKSPQLRIDKLNILLKACGPSLEVLDLAGSLVFAAHTSPLLDLTYNTRLCVLSFPWMRLSLSAPKPVWLPFVLSTIRSNAIEHITVILELGYIVHPWEWVDNLICADPHFTNLKKFTLSLIRGGPLISSTYDNRKFEQEFTSLPILHSRGILDFSVRRQENSN